MIPQRCGVWATANKMIINIYKTKETVFRRPNPRLEVDFPDLPV